ncbi:MULTISPECIES: helix-turn-helix domain-containing protein [Nostocales]|uniref:Helix-turn-helix transcriptional regulator n=3 Tax=Nostocales TaxID=1161 RepID=A0A0C1N8Z7_9CYAN|nr:AraC family transcriptional regulator [Tolypothrix bouteillei]KAF3885214.1 helix-turn-helix transcriptional regulator [Tolypothrix bouteillei VB521301]
MPEGKVPPDRDIDAHLAKDKFGIPMLSSEKAGWNNILVEYWQMPAHELPPQLLSDYIINLHFKGMTKAEIMWDGRLLSKNFTRGEITILPPGMSCKGISLEDSDFLVLRLQPNLITQVAGELGYTEQIEIAPNLGVLSPQIQNIGLALKGELESGCLSGRLYGESLATALASHLLQQHSTFKQNIESYTGGLPKYKLCKILEYINENLERELTLAELASVAEISSYHFARLFKQSTGFTPHQYVINCRIERAKKLLAEKQLSIAEIGDAIGFQSPSHFIALFRKRMAMTPKAYRDRL